MHRLRAREQLYQNCKILEVLKDRFWSASIIAEMGSATLNEFDRVYSNLQQSQSKNLSGVNGIRNVHPSTDGGAHSLLATSGPGNGAGQDLPNSDGNHGPEGPGFVAPSNITSSGIPSGNDVTSHLDLNVPNNMAEFDFFDMFDPAFGLSDIDAYLQGGLDLYFPFDTYNSSITLQ
jgi:hypothetical protein